MDRFEPRRVAVSFPSLRVDSVVGRLAEEVQRVRKTGFTIAPEAGTERLRRVINKDVDEGVLFSGAFRTLLKGLEKYQTLFHDWAPHRTGGGFERDRQPVKTDRSSVGQRQKIHPNVNVSVSTFVPKPHTPFQWEGQVSLEEMKERLHFLKDEVRRNRLHFKWQDPHLSFLEGIFSRGDRRLSRVSMEAHRLGCRFDGWSDQFRFPLWKEAFEKAGVDMDLGTRRRGFEDPLPQSFMKQGSRPPICGIDQEG